MTKVDKRVMHDDPGEKNGQRCPYVSTYHDHPVRCRYAVHGAERGHWIDPEYDRPHLPSGTPVELSDDEMVRTARSLADWMTEQSPWCHLLRDLANRIERRAGADACARDHGDIA